MKIEFLDEKFRPVKITVPDEPELYVPLPLISETVHSDLYYAVRTVVRAVVGILACEAAVAIALALAWLIWTLAGVTFA